MERCEEASGKCNLKSNHIGKMCSMPCIFSRFYMSNSYMLSCANSCSFTNSQGLLSIPFYSLPTVSYVLLNIWLRFWVHNILVTIILQTWHQITTTISAELILLGCSYTWLTLLGKFLLVLSPSPRPTRSWLCVRWTQHRHECTLTSQPFSDC